MPRRPDVGGLEGVLVVVKPAGPTSHDVVALVRRLSGTRRIGHGGTLDPFASGVLPLFLGGATRLVEYHLGDRKAYRATICFGASSPTDDLDGELIPVEGPPIEATALETALGEFRGEIRQRPPDYSAIQVQGRRAYALARAGSPADLPERIVTIFNLELVAWNSDDPGRPIAVVDVECSAGTYIRALARDLGRASGARPTSAPSPEPQVARSASRMASSSSVSARRRLKAPTASGRSSCRPTRGSKSCPRSA